MKIIFLTAMVAVLSLSACGITHVANLEKTTSENVEVFMSTKPVREYVEVQYILVEGSVFHNNGRLLGKLEKQAKKAGADAIVNVNFGYQSWWTYASAIAIKYK